MATTTTTAPSPSTSTLPRPAPSPARSRPTSAPSQRRAGSNWITRLSRHASRTGEGHRRPHTATIGAEYLACVAMIALSIGLGGKKDAGEDVLLSPAIAMVRLTAVSLLFFVLALASTGEKSGRLAAAFGALVTLGVALNASNEWRAIAEIFNPGHRGGHGNAEPGNESGGSPSANNSGPRPR